jgi:hypothetical protein
MYAEAKYSLSGWTSKAYSHVRLDTDGRTYYRRKRAADKTPAEALRCLKRRISDTIYKLNRPGESG